MATAHEEIGKDVESLKKDIENLRNDLGNMLGSVGNYSRDKVIDSKARLRMAMEDLKGRARSGAQHTWESSRDYSEQALNSSRECIGKRPFTAVAVSFAAGLVLASLMGHNHK